MGYRHSAGRDGTFPSAPARRSAMEAKGLCPFVVQLKSMAKFTHFGKNRTAEGKSARANCGRLWRARMSGVAPKTQAGGVDLLPVPGVRQAGMEVVFVC